MPDDLCAFANCQTPDEIEQVFLRLLATDAYAENWQKPMRAANARADELAQKAAFGSVFPRRLDKGTGNSERWEIAGSVYRTGTWGNGAGYRWCAASRDAWMVKKFQDAGVPEARIKNAVECAVSGYRWRCLRALWENADA